MTPARAIAALDRQLAQHGVDVTLQRLATGSPQTVLGSVVCRAQMRAQGTGDQKVMLANTVAQQDMTLIMSPTQIVAAGWQSGGPDQMVPVKGTRVLCPDRQRTVEAATPFYLNGVLVRLEVQVRG
jgi:hypothetical protein